MKNNTKPRIIYVDSKTKHQIDEPLSEFVNSVLRSTSSAPINAFTQLLLFLLTTGRISSEELCKILSISPSAYEIVR